LEVFRVNKDLFPESWNVFDSYAEALLANGDRDGAIANYRRSLELNPDSESGKRALAALESGPD
jgi:tetratricopeptide (TPR) repeat protein